MNRGMEFSLSPEDRAARGAVELDERADAKQPPMWRRLATSSYVWALAGILAVVAATAVMHRSHSPSGLTGNMAQTPRGFDTLAQASDGESVLAKLRQEAGTDSNVENPSAPPPDPGIPETGAITAPMIAETASLTIVPTNYDRAAGSIDALVAARGGYVQKLTSESRPDSSRQIYLTLRMPVKQMDASLADLRKLGRVEEESRENEEVTDQYVDLDARLESARAGEQRLIQLLQTRAGKLEDVLDAERELTRVRGEIESMSGERNLLMHRVGYATIEIQLQEQYHAQFSYGIPSGSLHNALVEGFRNLEGEAIAALAFALAYGPSLFFWLAIFSMPAWLAWRVVRRGLLQRAHVPKNI
jgi:Domain of unknown function (DUF4349)